MTLLNHAAAIVQQVEVRAQHGAPISDVLAGLRALAMEEFGELMLSLPNPEYPAISDLLPAMSSVETQQNWTGKSGLDLLAQTAAFVRQVQANYADARGGTLRDKTILDFGCGYGRILRLMYYFTDPGNLWGVDAWERSLDESRQVGILGNLALSESAPEQLPVGQTRFDLGYAFSVFTHLSPEAAEAALSAIRASMKPGGIFVATVRPVEYWKHVKDADFAAELIRRHENEGFAYVPHVGPEGEFYGESSIQLDFFDRPGWKIVGYDWSRVDVFQISLVLEAV